MAYGAGAKSNGGALQALSRHNCATERITCLEKPLPVDYRNLVAGLGGLFLGGKAAIQRAHRLRHDEPAAAHRPVRRVRAPLADSTCSPTLYPTKIDRNISHNVRETRQGQLTDPAPLLFLAPVEIDPLSKLRDVWSMDQAIKTAGASAGSIISHLRKQY